MPRELTPTGLTVKTVDEIRADLADAIQSKPSFGPTAQVHPYSVIGQMIDAIASEQVSIDEILPDMMAQIDPDTATGIFLEAHARAVGIADRKAATESTVVLTITGTSYVVVPAGTRYRVPSGPIFETNENATLAGGTVDVGATCTVTGPQQALAGTITEIVDGISGVTGVTNAADAAIGTAEETDAQLRARRERSLAAAGRSTTLALRSSLEALESVSYAEVLENKTLDVDSHGIPGKSFRAVIWPNTADASDIANAIYYSHAGGIRPDGTETATVTTAHGYDLTMRWEWAAELELYVRVEVTTNVFYPSSGDDDIAAAVLAYCQTLRPAQNVYPDIIKSIILLGGATVGVDTFPVVGIETVVVRCRIGAWPPGSGYTVPINIGIGEIAIPDSARITVV